MIQSSYTEQVENAYGEGENRLTIRKVILTDADEPD